MEVYVADSLYRLYSKPFTKTYLISFLENIEGSIREIDTSSTITCKNGWAVKDVIYELKYDESIILGATTKHPPKDNYQYVRIEFDELKIHSEPKDTVRFTKTFSIFE